jgi:hypothetical protein
MQTSRDERENDEKVEHITQVDVDLAEQDLRDREDDFTAAYNAMHQARIEVLKAKRSATTPKQTSGTPNPSEYAHRQKQASDVQAGR